MNFYSTQKLIENQEKYLGTTEKYETSEDRLWYLEQLSCWSLGLNRNGIRTSI
jgi:hypothetical protein